MQSQSAVLAVAVILAVGDDDVVGHVYSHGLARLLQSLRQSVVVGAGRGVVARMVVAQGYDGGVVEYRLAYYYAYVHGSLTYASVRYALLLYQSEVLVHKQHPRLFHVQVLHLGVHVRVDGVC